MISIKSSRHIILILCSTWYDFLNFLYSIFIYSFSLLSKIYVLITIVVLKRKPFTTQFLKTYVTRRFKTTDTHDCLADDSSRRMYRLEFKFLSCFVTESKKKLRFFKKMRFDDYAFNNICQTSYFWSVPDSVGLRLWYKIVQDWNKNRNVPVKTFWKSWFLLFLLDESISGSSRFQIVNTGAVPRVAKCLTSLPAAK